MWHWGGVSALVGISSLFCFYSSRYPLLNRNMTLFSIDNKMFYTSRSTHYWQTLVDKSPLSDPLPANIGTRTNNKIPS